MSDVEEKDVLGHSPASTVGGMRINKGYYPVSSISQEQKVVTVPKHKIEEFVETNCRALMLNRENKLGLLVNGKYVKVNDAFPPSAVISFREDKPCPVGKNPLSHQQPNTSFFQPKSFNEIARIPKR